MLVVVAKVWDHVEKGWNWLWFNRATIFAKPDESLHLLMVLDLGYDCESRFERLANGGGRHLEGVQLVHAMGKTSKGAVDPRMLEHPHNLTQELPDFCKVKFLLSLTVTCMD